jgi:hypothetical protein
MSKSKKIFNLGLALLLNFTASVCHSSTVEGSLSGAAAVIGKLANFKTFRMEPARLEALIKGGCTKTKEIKTDYSVVSVYGCSPKSGMDRVRMDWRNGDGDSHVVALSVDFNYAAYDNVKKAMEQNLGRASKRLKDAI